jgi:hypothetical protein
MPRKAGTLTARLWATPTTTPPTNAPGRLVIPPSTAAVKPGMRALKVRKPGPKLPTTGAVSIPAMPASRPVSPQVKLDRRRTEIPISSVATGSWLTPRMARPRLVREKNRPSNTASMTRAANTNMR